MTADIIEIDLSRFRIFPKSNISNATIFITKVNRQLRRLLCCLTSVITSNAFRCWLLWSPSFFEAINSKQTEASLLDRSRNSTLPTWVLDKLVLKYFAEALSDSANPIHQTEFCNHCYSLCSRCTNSNDGRSYFITRKAYITWLIVQSVDSIKGLP